MSTFYNIKILILIIILYILFTEYLTIYTRIKTFISRIIVSTNDETYVVL